MRGKLCRYTKVCNLMFGWDLKYVHSYGSGSYEYYSHFYLKLEAKSPWFDCETTYVTIEQGYLNVNYRKKVRKREAH